MGRCRDVPRGADRRRRCDPEECDPGKGEFRNQRILVGLDGRKTIPLSGFRKAKLRYDGRWTPVLTQR
ncbi:hypothetical protein AB0903_01660 [Streptomyces sp. NPDC048389]|uniref:hypothetical protein n=1 Tax=Streptomyces sp. NPDC048389 TaxID=3154622 RepID=UPI00345286E2